MKEATGELNMTVITVVAIAAVGALFTIFVWPAVQANIILSTACANVSTTGNYHQDDPEVECNDFNCTAVYKNKPYTRQCDED